MFKYRKLSMSALGVLALLVVSTWGWNSAQFLSAASPARVAANLPLSGPLGGYGSAIRDGAIFALERTRPDGAPELTFDWQDNAGDPKNTVTIMQRQFLQNPAIYVSGIKPQTMAIINQVTERGLPHFVWIFDPKINEKSSNNFRTLVSYKLEAQVYLDYAAKRAAKKVSILYTQLPHTIDEFERLVIPALRSKGLDVQVEAYEFGRGDFKDLAAKVKAFGPDLLILNGFQAELVAQIRALRPLSLISDGNTIATFDMLDAAKVLGKDESEGIRVVAPLFATQPNTGPIADWIRAFRTRFGQEPLYTHAFGYDMVLVLKDAARRVNSNPQPADWIKAIAATDIPGITGRLKFDVDGDLITPLEVGVYRGGALLPEAQAK